MSRGETFIAAKLQDNFLAGLNAWFDSAAPGEKEARVEAMQRIIQAKKMNSAELSLDGLGLSSIPAEIENLTDLEILNLGGNQLTTFPAKIMPVAETEISKELDTVKSEGFRSDQIASALRNKFVDRGDVYVIRENLADDSILCGIKELDQELIISTYSMIKDDFRFVCIPCGTEMFGTPHMFSLVIDTGYNILYFNDSHPSGLFTSSFGDAYRELLTGLSNPEIKNGLNYRDLAHQSNDWECGVHTYLNSIDIIDKITAAEASNSELSENDPENELDGVHLDEAAKAIIRAASTEAEKGSASAEVGSSQQTPNSTPNPTDGASVGGGLLGRGL